MTSTEDFEKNFPDLPPFPDDVPQVPLRRLSLQRLIDGDEKESEGLWEACVGFGFFHLDLRGADGFRSDGIGVVDGRVGGIAGGYENGNVNGHADVQTNGHTDGYVHGNVSGEVDGHTDGRSNGHTNGQTNGHTNGHSTDRPRLDGDRFLADAASLFAVSGDVFDLPVEEKVKYDLKDQDSYFGYKGYGAAFVDAKGTKDRNEFYNISKDDILGLSERLPAPESLKTHYPLVESYMCNAHSIVTLILDRLSTRLGLASAANGTSTLASLHALDSPSGDQVRFVRAPPQPVDDRQLALGAHTDFGSVTLLFNRLGGLQVYPPPGLAPDAPADGWMFVRPLPGHCIVNLGDALVKLTAGLLRSATHRVAPPPGDAQAALVRSSLVYFARPGDDVVLRALIGRGSEAVDGAAAAREAAGENEEVVTAREWTIRRALGRRGVAKYGAGGGTEIAGSVR